MKPYLIISQVLYLLSLLPWFVIWGLSFMSFDGGINFYNSAFVLIISLYPVAIITCSILGWVLHKKKQRAAFIVNLVPTLWVISFLAFMFINI
ncbi:hypothetical protein [Radiobacillus sp. PE A8.2]|uniref:hypothetical protein n=1 Tax=Radiobacillus sp. PE A8.2 TaxID=3380349 RepID=UPI003890B379